MFLSRMRRVFSTAFCHILAMGETAKLLRKPAEALKCILGALEITVLFKCNQSPFELCATLEQVTTRSSFPFDIRGLGGKRLPSMLLLSFRQRRNQGYCEEKRCESDPYPIS